MNFSAVLKIVRLPNLLLMAFTMFSFRHFVIIPILKFSGITSELNNFNFFLLVLSVLLIAAAGYVINDYYDVEIDEINKPEKVIIGKLISLDKAYLLFHMLGFTGVLIAFYLSFFGGIEHIAVIHLSCAGILWLYAAYFKKIAVLGNIIVGLLCAFTLFVTVYYDPISRKAEPIQQLLLGYCIFAFLLNLIREMIKDLEDLKGDLVGGCKTLPVIAGVGFSKKLILFLIIICVLLLGFVQYLQYDSSDWLSFSYIGVLLQLPLFYLFLRMIKGIEVDDFRFCSRLCKIIILTGILSMPAFYMGFS